MLNRMQQQAGQQMQASFDGLAERSMQHSGVTPDPENPAYTIGTMVAGSIIATISAAQENGKQIPPDVVLQSAVNLSQKLLSQYGLDEQQLDEALSSVFMVAMQLILDMGKGTLPENYIQAFNMFLQKLQGDSQQPQQQAEAPQPQGGM